MASSVRSGTPGRLVGYVLLWLAFGLLGAFFPTGLRFMYATAMGTDLTYRELFGFSTLLLVGFGILFSTVSDVFLDGHLTRIGAGMFATGMLIWMIVGPIIAVGVILDTPIPNRANSGPQGYSWLSGELVCTLGLLAYATGIKTRIWWLNQEAPRQSRTKGNSGWPLHQAE